MTYRILLLVITSVLFSACVPNTNTSTPVGDGDDDTTTPVDTSRACFFSDSAINTFLNGEYIEEDMHNNARYYSKTIPANCGLNKVYLYKTTSGQWYVAQTLGDTSFYARCTATPSPASPFDCDGFWEVASNIEPDVTVNAGVCPQLPCDSLSISSNANDVCDGSFNKISGENAYQSVSDSSVYFYFNPNQFKWQCGSQVNTTCSTSVYDQATGFQSTNVGNSINVDFDFSAETRTISCQ